MLYYIHLFYKGGHAFRNWWYVRILHSPVTVRIVKPWEAPVKMYIQWENNTNP